MLYLLFIDIIPVRRISVFNQKDEIEKATLDKSGKNVKIFLDDTSSNYSTIIDKGERHGDYVTHILMDILSGKNSTLNRFIENTKDDWYT